MGRTKSTIIFAIMVAIIALMAYTAAYGLQIGDWLIPNVFNEDYGVRQGLDLVGGSTITFEAQTDDTMSAAEIDADMDIVVEMLRERLDTLGYHEATIARVGEKRVRVEIPDITNPEEAVQKLGSTAQLEFIDGDGNVVLKGSEVKAASAEYGPVDSTNVSQNYVSLEFTEEGAKKFAEATQKYSTSDMIAAGKNYISIVLDGESKSVPYFQEELNTDKVMITGSFTAEEAKWLASIISSGQLPFSLKDVELRSVGPQLGEEALSTCLTSALIGIIFVMLFMTFIYKLPGFFSSIILVGYISIVGLILGGFRINLSLPGIAGIILSIGMAVDANVIIFERIKEELRLGKSLKSSIDSGFKRAFTAILDSNITTLIACAVLYKFGTGPIQGFAITLAIGICVSMFTAIVLTRLMLKCSVGMNFKNIKAYGA